MKHSALSSHRNSSHRNSKDESANWKQASLWLLFLGPFFFISYGFANGLASQHTEVSHIVFAWEKSIPFVPWTIIPYWSIDFLYALSLFICSTRIELNSHAKRLLSAQIIAVICFMLFPMGFTVERPESSGLFGHLFTTLSSFDQPFNQAPSLHITLLVILWVIYTRYLPRLLHWPFHLLCLLIGISVLTTYQHHFIDVPTGVLLGWFCVWLWPEDGHSMLSRSSIDNNKCNNIYNNIYNNKRRYSLASYYLIGALFFSILAFTFSGWALWLLWPAVSLSLVATFYAFIGAKGFQKSSHGRMSAASQWLLLPYLLATKLNSYLWTRKQPAASQIVDTLWLGRFPSSNEIKEKGYHTIIDMTAEMPVPSIAESGTVKWHTLTNLDLLTPPDKNLISAAQLIEQHMNNRMNKNSNQPILVTCALGYSRSVMAVIVWLLFSQHVKTIDEALKVIKNKHSKFVLKKNDELLLTHLIEKQLAYRMDIYEK